MQFPPLGPRPIQSNTLIHFLILSSVLIMGGEQ